MTARADQLQDRPAWGAWWDWPELAAIGQTDPEPDGYDVAVTIVQAPNGGLRVRLTLRRGGTPVRHLDMTGPLAQRVWPLVRDAALAGQEVG